jgi:hypothetical protein
LTSLKFTHSETRKIRKFYFFNKIYEKHKPKIKGPLDKYI